MTNHSGRILERHGGRAMRRTPQDRRFRYSSRLLLESALLIAIATSCEANSDWQTFLDDPSASSLARIEQAIASCDGEVDCRQARRPTSKELGELIALVNRDQPGAVEAGFAAMATLVFSAGDYNDLLQALASQIQKEPRKFLSLVKANYREPKLLTKMPSASVDDPAMQTGILRERIAAVERVSDPSLADERTWALDVLRKSLGPDQGVE